MAAVAVGRRFVASAVLSIAVVVVAMGAVPAVAAPAGRQPKLATEVCEQMVRDAIEATINGPLAGKQVGAWQGTTYTCTYPFGDGTLALRVQVLADKHAAKAAYGAVKKQSIIDQPFNGLGQAAFQAKDGTVVARKDRFVLTADPSQVPARLNKTDLAFAATVAVLSCWTGESK